MRILRGPGASDASQDDALVFEAVGSTNQKLQAIPKLLAIPEQKGMGVLFTNSLRRGKAVGCWRLAFGNTKFEAAGSTRAFGNTRAKKAWEYERDPPFRGKGCAKKALG